MATLTLLTRIMTLVMILIIFAVLKILIAVLGILTLILVVIFEICLGGIIVVAPWTEATIPRSVSVVNRTFFLGTKMILPCLTDLFAPFLRFLALLFGMTYFLVFVLFQFVLLLPSTIRAIAVLVPSHNQNGLV